jgi:hypothetical protein
MLGESLDDELTLVAFNARAVAEAVASATNGNPLRHNGQIEPIFACNICGTVFDSAEAADRHSERRACIIGPCNWCGQPLSLVEPFNVHVKTCAKRPYTYIPTIEEVRAAIKKEPQPEAATPQASETWRDRPPLL